MKRLSSVILWLSALVLVSCERKGEPVFPADVESRIQQVEENLSGVVPFEGQPKWNLTDRMAFHKVRGLSVAVIHNYRIDWAKGYGWADESQKREVTPATLFQAASISKSLNAIGVLRLAQERKVDLNSDINTYLTSWKFPYDAISKNKKITLTHLLSHTAGLSVHGFRGYASGEAIPTIVQTLDGLPPANNQPIRALFEPELKVQYSGGGTTISQLVVTDVTGSSYPEYMKTAVLQPLGMTTSSYGMPDASTDSSLLATGYMANGREVIGKFHVYPEQAAASLWTNPTELATYIIETQLSLEGKSSKVLSQEFTQIRLTPVRDNAALGVFIDTKGDEKYFQHSGGNEGFRSYYFGSMEKGYGAVVMVNSDNGAIIQEVLRSIAGVYQWNSLYDEEVKKIVELTDDELKQFEGFYRSKENQDTHIQFTIKDHQLVLKQLWDGREITFSPESGLEFFCKDSPFPLKFTRKDDAITEVLAFNRDVWIKDNDYKMVVKTPIHLQPAIVKAFEGKYQAAENRGFAIQITSAGDHLILTQLWDREELIFVPESDLKFFARDNQFFPIRFIKGASGEVTQAIAFERDVFNKVQE